MNETKDASNTSKSNIKRLSLNTKLINETSDRDNSYGFSNNIGRQANNSSLLTS